MQQSGRLWGLDALKAIAICMVVPLHTGLFHPDFIASPGVQTFVQFAFRLLCEGVPIFFFVNGFLLFRKPGLDMEKHIRRTKKVAILLVVWTVLLIVAGMLKRREPMSLGGVVQAFVQTKIGAPDTGVLWYLQTLIALYLLYPLFKIAWDSGRGG